MKRLFILLAISSLGFVACNSAADGENAEATTDSLTVDPATENTTVNAADTVNLDTTATPADASAQ